MQNKFWNVDMNIRELTQNDYSDWCRLWTGYLEFYETSVPEEVYQTTFQRLISDEHPNQMAFAAENDGILVGLVHYIRHPHNWKIEDVIYLQDLFTAPTARGKGVARALIEAVYKAADDGGTPTVYWLTQDHNKTARILYDNIATLTSFIKYNR